MKRKFYLVATLLLSLMLALCAFTGCKPSGTTEKVTLESVTENMVVMKVIKTKGEASALSALTKLKEDNQIEFEHKDSGYGAYITSINGKSEVNGYSWMLYTSDTEFSTTEFGSVTYDGKTYGQASLGASSLVVKEGELYIWAYTAWM